MAQLEALQAVTSLLGVRKKLESWNSKMITSDTSKMPGYIPTKRMTNGSEKVQLLYGRHPRRSQSTRLPQCSAPSPQMPNASLANELTMPV